MKEGVFMHADNFYLRILNRKDSSPSLFGFVVPAKVEKTSAGRHLLKRKMTAAVENIISDICLGFSGIFFVKKGVSHLSYTEIEKEIVSLLIKAKILNKTRF